MKTGIFQSCGHYWVFQICWHIECSNFTASSFRIWNNNWNSITSTSFVCSDFLRPTWLLTAGCLALGEWRHHSSLCHKALYCEFLCVFLPLLLNLFCFLRISVLYCVYPCMIYSLDISNFLKRSLVFPILLLFSISLHYLRRPAYLSFLFSGILRWAFPFLPWLSLLFFPQLFVKSPPLTTFPSSISFSLGWFWSLPPKQCYKSLSIVVQALDKI